MIFYFRFLPLTKTLKGTITLCDVALNTFREEEIEGMILLISQIFWGEYFTK